MRNTKEGKCYGWKAPAEGFEGHNIMEEKNEAETGRDKETLETLCYDHEVSGCS